MTFKLATILLYGVLASGQVTVPLTDPFVFGGNGHYNETLCGGTIYLPDISDSLSLTFNGSDFQFEFIVDPKADPVGLIVEPDDITVSQGSGTVLEPSLLPPQNCSDRSVYRLSEIIKGQLYLGNHTATVINQGRAEYKGTGTIVSRVQYDPDPLPGLPTLSSEPGSRSSHGRNKAIIGGVVGGIIGFLALVVPTIVMIYRRRRSAKRGEVKKPQLDLLTPGDRAIVGQDGEGLAPTPAEKSENAATTDQMAISAILQNEPQRNSVPVVLPQATQPPSTQGSKPLPSPPSTQLPLPAQSPSLGSHLPPGPQLSPQQLRLVQELMDQGLPSSQVAGVVQSMLASGGSRNTDATPLPTETPGHVNDAPPQYDFKDRPASDGM